VFDAVQGVPRSQRARVAVQTIPPTAALRCEIVYYTPSGNKSEAAGLEPTQTNGQGRASWSWVITRQTLPGRGKVHVTCEGSDWVAADIDIL